MSIYRNSCLFIICIASVFALAGCFNKQSPVEKIYKVLENVVSAEKVFEEQQEPLVELENNEKEIYDKIISLGMKEVDEINKLSDEASAIVEKRKSHLNKEQESIKASEAQFDALPPLIEEIEESPLKEKAQELYDIMMGRYDSYHELYENYSAATQLDKDLYALFKKEDLQIEQLEEQITKINDVYKKVLDGKEEFNEKTKQYNDTKLSFYKDSGLKINMDEEKN